MPVSVLILTHNEEVNLPGCLAALGWCDDVVVFDSFSADRTVDIAREAGARVYQRVFDNYGAQREAARTQVPYRHPWVLAVDADEQPDAVLVQELGAAAASGEDGPAAYRLRRKDYFLGRWIRHATLYPSWFVRLYRPDRIRYEARAVHEYPTVDGKVAELRGHLVHHSFNKGMDEWLGKHVRYAAMEAQQNLKQLREGGGVDWSGLWSWRDPVRRRRTLKGLSVRLPLRPVLRFVYMYLLRGGVLDGRPGLTYCMLLAMYEYMIVLKLRELRRKERGLPV